jgi:hypothetical protein
MSDIVARAEKALVGVTDGPWVLSEPDGNWIWPHVCNTYASSPADSAFIAAARTLVPELVAELKTARAEAERLQTWNGNQAKTLDLVGKQLGEQREEIERLGGSHG